MVPFMPVASEPVLRLRTAQLRKHARRLGLETPWAIAKHLRVSHTTVQRTLSGDMAPGERFIAKALAGFPDLEFADLFEVVDKPEGDPA